MASATNNNNSEHLAASSEDSETSTLIHTTYAKVYSMPLSSSAKNWSPLTSFPVPVSFYYDKLRNVYRILCYDEDTIVINSSITPAMSFSKPSSSFGIWTDGKLRTVFGLGFSSQASLDLTSEWFERVVKAAESLEKIKQADDEGGGEDHVGEARCFTDSDPKDPISTTTSTPPHSSPTVIVGAVQLEQELEDLKTLYTITHEDLLQKTEEGESLLRKVRELEEALQKQINLTQLAELQYAGEKSRVELLEKDVKELKVTIGQLQMNRYLVQEVDKDLTQVEENCAKISESLGELCKIQNRLRKNFGSPQL